MSLVRASIKICSRLQTPLRGDTIWGHIACGIANHEGNEGVDKFCRLDPPFVISSAFPHGMLPKPLLPLEESAEEFKSKQEYTEFKQSKKLKYCNASDYLDLDSCKVEEQGFVLGTSTHVMISRDTGAALDEMLFSENNSWPVNGSIVMDIYICSNLAIERIKELLFWGFEFGYGADVSTGAGKITLLDEIRKVVQKKPKYGRYLALGPFVSDEVLSDLRASTFVRKGRIGGLLSDELVPYKKSVIMYDEGATFLKDCQREYVGKLLHNMHVTKKYDICHSAFAPVIEV